MDSEIPERYVDVLLQEFAYDPVRLPLTEDPAQVLYNRKTLENIWDAKHEAVNPFTRQPFDITNVIPQTELRQEMQRYIVDNSSLTLKLDVISDYTQILSEADMKILMEGLILDYKCLVDVEKGDVQEDHYWKVLWQKFNLLRLYCQYLPENRVAFCSIGGYQYLLPVLDEQFSYLCYRYTSSFETLKQVCKLVDLIGLKDTHFPPELLFRIFTALSCLVFQCDQLKIRSMVLRIYRQMFYDLNVENLLGFKLNKFCFYIVKVTLCVLKRGNLRDIANEDLYNGMLILKAAWMKYRMSCINSESNCVGVVIDSVIICISRLHRLHHAAITDESRSRMLKKNNENFELISVALEGGFWLINDILRATYLEVRENKFFSQSKETLQESNIVTEIVRMVELVLAGFKCLGSTHLQFGINIVVEILKEEGSERRDDVVRVFGDFLGSDMVDEYDSHVKLSLQEFMHSSNASEQVTLCLDILRNLHRICIKLASFIK